MIFHISPSFRIPIFMLRNDCCHISYFKEQPYRIIIIFFLRVFYFLENNAVLVYLSTFSLKYYSIYGIESAHGVYLYFFRPSPFVGGTRREFILLTTNQLCFGCLYYTVYICTMVLVY